MPSQLRFKSTQPDVEVDDVLSRLRKLEGVSQVAKEPTVEGVQGFIIFESPELAAAARNRVTKADPFVLLDPAQPRAQKGDGATKSGTKAEEKKKLLHGGKVLPFTADFFNGPSPSTMPHGTNQRQQGRGGRGGRGVAVRGRGRGGRGGNRRSEETDQQQVDGEEEPRQRHQRRPRNGAGPNGGGYTQRNRRTFEAFVACVHNVAPNVTNDSIFHAFKGCGHILEIRRSERLALVFMRDAPSVTEAIVAWNGKEFFGNVATVVDAGSMQLPVPPPPSAPAPPVPPHMMQGPSPMAMPPVPVN